MQGTRGWACAYTTTSFHDQLHAYGAGVIWNGTGWDGCSGGIAVFLSYHLIISDSLSTSLIKVHAEQGWNTMLDFPQVKTVFIAIFLCAFIHIIL